MKTRRERLIEALLKRGFVEVPSTSRKYRTFQRPTEAGRGLVFVGKMGALRGGTCVSKSMSWEATADRMLAADEAEAKSQS